MTTGDWSFEMNLERLRHEEDPRLELLEAVAQALGDSDPSRLDAFEEWRDLEVIVVGMAGPRPRARHGRDTHVSLVPHLLA